MYDLSKLALFLLSAKVLSDSVTGPSKLFCDMWMVGMGSYDVVRLGCTRM